MHREWRINSLVFPGPRPLIPDLRYGILLAGEGEIGGQVGRDDRVNLGNACRQVARFCSLIPAPCCPGDDTQPVQRPTQRGVKDGSRAACVPGRAAHRAVAMGMRVGQRPQGIVQGIVECGGGEQHTSGQFGGPTQQATTQDGPVDAAWVEQERDEPAVVRWQADPGLLHAHALFALRASEKAVSGDGGVDALVVDGEQVKPIEQRQEKVQQWGGVGLAPGGESCGQQADALLAQQTILAHQQRLLAGKQQQGAGGTHDGRHGYGWRSPEGGQVKRGGQPVADVGREQVAVGATNGRGSWQQPAQQQQAFADGLWPGGGSNLFQGANGAIAGKEVVGTQAIADVAQVVQGGLRGSIQAEIGDAHGALMDQGIAQPLQPFLGAAPTW